jgi:hypothetical protein
MAKRAQNFEIFAPTLGRKHDAPSTLIDLRAMPDGYNNKLDRGKNSKEDGTTLFATGAASVLTASPSAIYEARFPTGSVLQVLSSQALKYSAGNDSFVSDGQIFAGTWTDPFSVCMYNDACFYSNGVDPIQVKPTFAATGTDLASALSPDTYKAISIAPFHEHLCLYHTIENGTEFYKRIRWTKKGTLALSAGTTDFATGTYGAIDIPECDGEIKCSVPLGPIQAIYAERCIILQTWVGDTEVYRFTKALSGIGTPSRRGAASNGLVNWFIGQSSFYEYRGGEDLVDIGLPISSEAFSEVNANQLSTAFTEYDVINDKVLFHIPTGTSTSPDTVWVYSRKNSENPWAVLQRAYKAAGSYTRQNTLTFGDAQGKFEEQTAKWGDYISKEGAEVSLYADAGGYIVKKDPTVVSVISSGTSSPQVFTYVTPDLPGLRETKPYGTKLSDPYDKDEIDYTSTQKRYLSFEFEAFGAGSASVEFSEDLGRNYQTMPGSPVTLAVDGETHTLDFDYTAKQMRFRVVNSGTNEPIAITYAKVTLVPGSVQ